MKARTKDERFVLALYLYAKERGDPFLECNKYIVGEKVGLRKKATETICNLLAQCNFIKKRDKDQIFLTEHGLDLITSLEEE